MTTDWRFPLVAATLAASALLGACAGVDDGDSALEITLTNPEGKEDGIGQRKLRIMGWRTACLDGEVESVVSVLEKKGQENDPAGYIALHVTMHELTPQTRTELDASRGLDTSWTGVPGLILWHFVRDGRGSGDWLPIACGATTYFSSNVRLDVLEETITDGEHVYTFAECGVDAANIQRTFSCDGGHAMSFAASVIPVSDWTGLEGDYTFDLTQTPF